MAYNNGPLISPALFREFMLPRYKRLIGFLRDHGVRHFCVDTDGDCCQLIPLFLECGMTGMLPFEVQSGMDIVAVRQASPACRSTAAWTSGPWPRAKPPSTASWSQGGARCLRQGGYIPFATTSCRLMCPGTISSTTAAAWRR